MISAIYRIGKSISESQEPIDCLIKPIKVEEEKKNYILKIVFDLTDNKILINSDNLINFDVNSAKRFTYCGNNGRREKQFYLSRELKSVNYLFEKTFHDLKYKLESEQDETYKDNQLYQYVLKIINCFLGEDKNVFDYINTPETISDDKKEKISEAIEGIKKNKITPVQLISKLTQLMRNEKIVLVTPSIIFSDNIDGRNKRKEINLAETDEYKQIVMSKLKPTPVKKSKNKLSFCYLCKGLKSSSSENLTKISTLKLFTTTTINSASNINNKNYDKNFRICHDCLAHLKAAEGFIKENMRITMAGTPTFLIPNVLSLKEEINPKEFEKVHTRVDMAFSEQKFKGFVESIEDSFEDDNTNFSLDFLSYESGGSKFFKVINHVHDVPEFYFSSLTQTIAKHYLNYENEIKGEFNKVFCLGSIYKLIPIKFSKDKKGKYKISDKRNKALQFFAQLLERNKIEKNIIFSYFCDAMYHIYMGQQDVYRNLTNYKEDNFDFAVKDYFYRYLVLLRTLKDLKLIDEEETIMEKKENTNVTSDDIENYLYENNYNNQHKALFYLGVLVNQVAISQSKKGHKKKPILKKINYQGMSVEDLKRLYVDVFEKLVQYDALYPNVENYNSLCKIYFDKCNESWSLSEFENVFYLLSGYAYKVANRSDNSDVENTINEGEE